jgi:microcystin-dependent protein
MASAAVQTPAGYLLCDGTAVSRTTFSTLFNACTFQTTGNITNGSTGITNVGSTTNLVAGMPISAPGLPTGTTITAVGAATITLSQAAIATTVGVALVIAPYGVGDGSTTFNVPDMRGRAPFGADKMVGSSAGAAGRLGSNSSAGGFSSTVTMGTGGGAQTHVQTAGELVSHSHANTLNDPTHFHQQLGGAGNNDGAGGNGPGTNPGNTAAASTGITITNVATGGGAAMNITPPGLAFNWYVKT